MSKRFTDTKKWRNAWFRALPIKAKLVWSYLCDECEYYGVWKADYDLASFQVGFSFSQTDLENWFSDKMHFFDVDKVLIIPFFGFQYKDSKDTWSVKVNAVKKLESLGFSIIDNEVQKHTVEDIGGTVEDSAPNVLIKVKGKGSIKKGGVGENKSANSYSAEFESFWSAYPRKEGKVDAAESFAKNVNPDEFEKAVASAQNFAAKMRGKDLQYVKLPSTFLNKGRWREHAERPLKAVETPQADIASPTMNWTKAAMSALKACECGDYSEEYAIRQLGPEIAGLVKTLGGLEALSAVTSDSVSIRILADKLKANFEQSRKVGA